jgi:hypothetical protein
MKTIQRILACVLLAACAWAAAMAGMALWAVARMADAVPGELAATRRLLEAEADAMRAQVDGQLTVARKETLGLANRQATVLRTETLGEMDAIRVTVDQRTGDALQRVDAAVEVVQDLRGDLKPLLDHAGSVAGQVDGAAPLYLDCEFNPDCAFNRFQGASKAFERAAINFGQMSQDARVALPGFVKNADSLVADSAATAANIKRLTTPKWYDRIIGYVLNGVVIYRNLNPVTNLTVTGATILSSSRP